jgi:hypothetical protein
MKLEKLAKKYKYRCFWCKRKFRLFELSRDHIETNLRKYRHQDIKNNGECVLACKQCNQNRGNTSFFYYKSKLYEKDRGI